MSVSHIPVMPLAMRQESFVENLVSPISAAVERFGDKAHWLLMSLARESLEETEGFLVITQTWECFQLFFHVFPFFPTQIRVLFAFQTILGMIRL